ncbi:MAG: RNA-binding transcriptional accessory protein [Bacteroidales bacterium]|nr:RNA-binding transcriptional accessory protein [Bacteroidales bacterium]
MTDLYIKHISAQLGVNQWQALHCVELLEEGATIPFISRYRKERTGGLDEVQVGQIKHYFVYFTDLDKRKAAILKSIEEQDKLTGELRAQIEAQVDATALEDIYLPYRPKKRTRAMVARERGLEPLADAFMGLNCPNPADAARKYINKDVPDAEAAIAGAKDIIAERISENTQVRSMLRGSYFKWGTVVSKQSKEGAEKEEESANYRSWFNYREPLQRIAPHRLLAILRGASEGMLSVKVDVDSDRNLERISRIVLDGRRPASRALGDILNDAMADSFKRLLHPSIENEVLRMAKEKADISSIKVFGENLRQLLLAPPVGQKRVMAIDPGFRTGCKVVCLDAQGNLLHNDTIYPHPPMNERISSMKKINDMVEKYGVEVIAIGSGTAGRETESFIQKLFLPENIKVYMVSEDGASVYSASEVAREEFPDYDVTVRGAVSIGRRLMDPLSELVKIDPKSIGVGQYQHDVDQGLLKEELDNTVESCVNNVGVNLNTASVFLLQYVSGVGPALAANIVDYRTANGNFTSREQLLGVRRLGAKAYEQCAGFLRIPGAANPLDNSAVHPERYPLVQKMAADIKVAVGDLVRNDALCDSINLDAYVDNEVGLPTLRDIISELKKPGRDPRGEAATFAFSEEIRTIDDVREGMIIPGIVTNITDFGAFVDIGIKQSGLIHVSRMGGGRDGRGAVRLKIQQHVQVRVVSVDLQRGRIGLALHNEQ